MPSANAEYAGPETSPIDGNAEIVPSIAPYHTVPSFFTWAEWQQLLANCNQNGKHESDGDTTITDSSEVFAARLNAATQAKQATAITNTDKETNDERAGPLNLQNPNADLTSTKRKATDDLESQKTKATKVPKTVHSRKTTTASRADSASNYPNSKASRHRMALHNAKLLAEGAARALGRNDTQWLREYMVNHGGAPKWAKLSWKSLLLRALPREMVQEAEAEAVRGLLESY